MDALKRRFSESGAFLSGCVWWQVRRLLDGGMDVNAAAWGPKSKGVTPLHLAAQGGHLKVMDELLERGANIDARTKGACGCEYPLALFNLFFFSRRNSTSVSAILTVVFIMD